MADPIVTPAFIAEARRNIDEQETRQAGEDDDNRKRAVEIYDDFCECDNGQRVLRMPQPTLGMLMLYRERREYFWDDEYGVGRLLVALRRQKEGRGKYIRGLRMGGEIPDAEADAAMADVYAEDVVDYYAMMRAAEKFGDEETEKKTAKLAWGKEGEVLLSVLREASLNLSNLRATPSTKSSTECTSAPSVP